MQLLGSCGNIINILNIKYLIYRYGDYCLEIVKMLVESGCDINIKSKDEKTALDISIEYNHPEITDYLRQYYIQI